MLLVLKNRLKYLLNYKKGTILIEFAFSLPVLIIILFFITDGPLAYRTSNKLQKMSELTAQMILNIKGRHVSPLTIDDLVNISRAAGIALTNVKDTEKYPFHLSTYIMCIRGTGANSFEIKWNIHIDNNLVNQQVIANANDDLLYSSINKNTTNLKGTLANFVIQPGELQLLIETVAWYSDNGRGFNKNFYLLTIPGQKKNNAKTFGDRFAIITPPSGLISESIPPSLSEN